MSPHCCFRGNSIIDGESNNSIDSRRNPRIAKSRAYDRGRSSAVGETVPGLTGELCQALSDSELTHFITKLLELQGPGSPFEG